jgi:KUP system potassium uptake protein
MPAPAGFALSRFPLAFMNDSPASSTPAAHAGPHGGLAALTLAALGVVYGDIGTSPLYTMKEVFDPHRGLTLDAANLIGAVSAIFWALMLVVTLKYVLLILRADNRGEGGVLALTALATEALRERPAMRRGLLLLGVFGATLFYGDSVITPAISVLGAMEGMEVLTPALKPYVVPASVLILLLLFAVQRHGTHVVGRWFGPIVLGWFLLLGVSGAVQIAREPAILQALNPLEGLAFLWRQGPATLLVVGALVLALTGAEALYADLGHFGRRSIQTAWLLVVLPGLALNYMGQGALLMHDPAALANPFFLLFSQGWLLPALVLATLAAIIASQAVISGAYSMTKQAMALGFLPRLRVQHTSARAEGQIYVPAVNALLLVGVLGAVLLARSSGALASAYGIAVTVTMLITTVLTFFVVRDAWRLPRPLAWGATAFFLAVDLLLVAGCLVKFFDGGWMPLAAGLALFLVMSTWFRGRELMMDSLRADGLELTPFLEGLAHSPLPRAQRVALYLVANGQLVPQALLHNLKHNQVLHERNFIVTVCTAARPFVPEAERCDIEALPHGFQRVRLHFGFMETPDVPRALAAHPELQISAFESSYFLSRETVVPTPGAGMATWRERLFAAMSQRASGIAGHFRLPDNAVVELGTRVQI